MAVFAGNITAMRTRILRKNLLALAGSGAHIRTTLEVAARHN